MKRVLQKCIPYNDETWHSIGKKQATNKSKPYTRRRTLKCNRCGRREINNMKSKNKTIIGGKNESP